MPKRYSGTARQAGILQRPSPPSHRAGSRNSGLGRARRKRRSMRREESQGEQCARSSRVILSSCAATRARALPHTPHSEAAYRVQSRFTRERTRRALTRRPTGRWVTPQRGTSLVLVVYSFQTPEASLAPLLPNSKPFPSHLSVALACSPLPPTREEERDICWREEQRKRYVDARPVVRGLGFTATPRLLPKRERIDAIAKSSLPKIHITICVVPAQLKDQHHLSHIRYPQRSRTPGRASTRASRRFLQW